MKSWLRLCALLAFVSFCVGCGAPPSGQAGDQNDPAVNDADVNMEQEAAASKPVE